MFRHAVVDELFDIFLQKHEVKAYLDVLGGTYSTHEVEELKTCGAHKVVAP